MAKPHLNVYDFQKLIDDIKLISRSIKIVVEEDDYTKRKFDALLTENLMTRLFRDIKEMHEIAPDNNRGYGGYLDEEKGEQDAVHKTGR